MPWCPKCRNEYQEGITVCADCGLPLVDELAAEDDFKAVAFIDEETLAGRLVDYLKYSNIQAVCEYDASKESYCVRVAPEKLEEAKNAFGAFYKVEKSREARDELAEKIRSIRSASYGREDNETPESLDAAHVDDADASGTDAQSANTKESNEAEGDMADTLESLNIENLSDEEKQLLAEAIVSEQVYKPAEVYVTKADESRDMFSTAITFLVFAVGLIVFLLLNVTGVMTMFSNTASIITIGALAVGCCFVGINAIKRSRRAEIASHDEEKLTKAIRNWFEENISRDDFSELDTEEISEEILYLKRVEIIRNKLADAFPGLTGDYTDALIDDFYDTYFTEPDNEVTP